MQTSLSALFVLALTVSCQTSESKKPPSTTSPSTQVSTAEQVVAVPAQETKPDADAAPEPKPKPLWDEDPDSITAIKSSRGIRSVRVRRRKGKLQIRQRVLYEPGRHDARFVEGGEEWVEYWAAPTPTRALGKLEEKSEAEDLADFLVQENSGSISISWGSRTRHLQFYNLEGERGRYVVDLETNQLYLFEDGNSFFTTSSYRPGRVRP